MLIVNQVEKYRKEVKTDHYTPQWKEIISSYIDGDLIIDPDFQRLFRWSKGQQTAFIESILLGIPVPPLFFIEEENSKYTVIDGVQRISTILKFFAKEVFKENTEEVSAKSKDDQIIDLTIIDEDSAALTELLHSEDYNIKIPSTLVNGPILKQLEDYNAETLPEALVRSIRYSRIPVITLTKDSDKTARYEVFMRLNRSGSRASDQEIRNCSARVYGSSFPDELRDIAIPLFVRRSLNLSPAKEQIMGVEEAILRLLAFNHADKEPSHDITSFLDDFMKYASEGKFKLTNKIKEKLMKSFILIDNAFDKGKAFKPARSGFSTNLFDVVATGVYHNIDSLTEPKFKKRHKELLESKELKALVGAGSNTRKKMVGRIELGKKWFS